MKKILFQTFVWMDQNSFLFPNMTRIIIIIWGGGNNPQILANSFVFAYNPSN